MFVGSDNPLYYIYSTFRSEFAYFNNTGVQRAIHDGIFGATPALQRFMTLPLTQAGVKGVRLSSRILAGGNTPGRGTARTRCWDGGVDWGRPPQRMHGRLAGLTTINGSVVKLEQLVLCLVCSC
jgi:hypothetical protein